MRRLLLFFCIISISTLCIAALPCYALGDGSSCSPDMPESSGIINLQQERGRSAILTFGYERIINRELEDEDKDPAIDGEMEANWALLGLGYRINNRIEPYLRVGISDMNLAWNENGSKITADSDNSLAIGLGLKALLYKAKLTSLSQFKINFDVQARGSRPSFETATIDGTSRTVSAAEFRIIEGRAATTMAVDISLKDLLKTEEGGGLDIHLVPYVGILYTNSLITGKFDYNGVSYGYLDTFAKKNVSFLGGLDIVTPKYLLLNIEGQIFGDESLSGGVNIKF